MTLIPLKLPAGFKSNGTDLENSNAWLDGSLVRWHGGSLRPVGGWAERVSGFGSNTIRGMHAWQDLTTNRWIAGGSYNELKISTSGGTIYDITPVDLAAGDEISVLDSGYGSSLYGSGLYGYGSQSTIYAEATSWSIDNWGEYLVSCSTEDGRLLEWQLTAPNTTHITEITPSVNSSTWTYVADTDDDYNFYYYTTSPSANRYILTQVSVTPKTYYRVSWNFYDNPSTTGQQVIARLSLVYNDGTPLQIIYNDTYTQGQTKLDDIYVGDNVARIDLRFESVATSNDVSIFNVKIEGQENLAAPITNAPIDNLGLVVTEERFLFALGAGGNPRKVQWCDQENNTSWTPAATNQAGDIELQTSGQIMQAVRARGQTLILTDVDAHVATYQGPPFVYGFQRVSGGCGAVSRMTAVAVDQGVFWMGQRGFFLFNGNSVQEIPCDVLDHVFTNMNQNQKTQSWAFNNSQHGEIWWFYCSDGSTTIDKYVAYNHKENHWLIGDLARTAGVERGVFKEPILCDYSNVLHRHEFGLDYGGASVYAETGPISLGNGDQTMHVTQLIPDENTQGEVTVTFKSRFYPNDTETSFGPYTPANPTSVRFAGRQFRMRINGVAEKDWRVGNMRVDAVPAGKR